MELAGRAKAEQGSGLSEEAVRRGIRAAILDNVLNAPMANLLAGTYLTGFMRVLGASQFQNGLKESLVSTGAMFQLGASYLIEKLRVRKPIWIAGVLLSRLTWVFALLIATQVAMPAAWRPWVLLGGIALQGIFASCGGLASSAWLRDFLGSRTRGSYIALRSMLTLLMTIIATLVAGMFLDSAARKQPKPPPAGAQIAAVSPGATAQTPLESQGKGKRRKGPGDSSGDLPIPVYLEAFGVALVLSLAGVVCLTRVPEPPMSPAPEHKGFHKLAGSSLRDPNLPRILAFQMLWGMSTRLTGAPINVYMLEGLAVPFTWIALYQNVARWSNLVQNRFWGRVVDRLGNRPVLLMNCCLLASSGLLWLVATRSNYMFVLPVLYMCQGLANSGIGLSQTNLVLRLAPEQGASTFLATFNTANAVAFAAAPAIGGLVADRLEGVHVTVGPFALQGLHFLVLASFLMRLGAILALRTVEEPEARSVARTVRTLGRLRTCRRRHGNGRSWPRPLRHAPARAGRLFAALPHPVQVAARRCEPYVTVNPLVWAFRGAHRVSEWRGRPSATGAAGRAGRGRVWRQTRRKG